MVGKIISVKPMVKNVRLKVRVTVLTNRGEIRAYIPERELAVLLPRSLFISEKELKAIFFVTAEIQDMFRAILQRLTNGRFVNLRKKGRTWYVLFQQWNKILVDNYNPSLDGIDLLSDF